MTTTSNYGFPQEVRVCAIDTIDRELKRIEGLARCKVGVDKCEFSCHPTDAEAHQELFEQKVDKQEGYSLISVDCLKQICTNSEALVLVQKLIEKLQEKGSQHLTDSNAHKELLDKKVDKQEGYSLISQELTKQISANKEGLALLEQLVQKLQETDKWVAAELAKKVDQTDSPELNVALADGFTPYSSGAMYWKNALGEVHVNIEVDVALEIPVGENVTICVLPEGFRPARNRVELAHLRSKGATPAIWKHMVTGVSIDTNGRLAVILSDEAATYTSGRVLALSFCYQAK